MILFIAILSLFLLHEMDAIRAKEWKMFVILKNMPEKTAGKVFIFLHLPLYFVAFYLLIQGGETARYVTQLVVDILLIGHAALHFGFRRHPSYGFRSLYSRVMIYGTALLALVHAAWLLRA